MNRSCSRASGRLYRPSRGLGPFAVVTGAVLLSATGLAGQIPGNIDWPAVPGGVGVSVATDMTNGLNSASGEALYAGARVLIAMPRSAIWFGGGYAGMRGAGDNVATGGAGFAYALTESGPTILSVDAGVGLTRSSGTWLWGVPAGLTLWIDPPPASVVRPFLRAHGLLVGGGSGTDFGFSGIGGAEFRLPNGLGLHLALQWEIVDQDKPLVIGGGLRVGL